MLKPLFSQRFWTQIPKDFFFHCRPMSVQGNATYLLRRHYSSVVDNRMYHWITKPAIIIPVKFFLQITWPAVTAHCQLLYNYLTLIQPWTRVDSWKRQNNVSPVPILPSVTSSFIGSVLIIHQWHYSYNKYLLPKTAKSYHCNRRARLNSRTLKYGNFIHQLAL